MGFTPHKTIRRARGLRRELTEAEKRLWGHLRERRLGGFKFVRQEAVGPFIADFVCRDCKLIVEVDGATHSEDHEIAHDARRTAYLQQQGYRVLRLQNAEVFSAMDDVLETIVKALESGVR